MSNYIFNPEVDYRPSYPSAMDIIETGLRCVMDTVSFEVDVESGFYEHAGHLIPKTFKLALNIDYLDTAKEYGVDFNSDSLWPHGMDWINPAPSANESSPVVTPAPPAEQAVEEPATDEPPPVAPANPPDNVPTDPPDVPTIPGAPSVPAGGAAV